MGENVEKYHHTLIQIINGLIETGFAVETMEEAMPSREMQELPGMEDEMKRPMMLLVKAGKQAAGSEKRPAKHNGSVL